MSDNEQEIVSPASTDVDSLSANVISKYLRPALIKAAKEGDQETIKELIQLRFDVNFKDSYGNTALICASGKPECVKLLLEAKADVNTQNKYSYTALIQASNFGYTECVKLLEAAIETAKPKDSKLQVIEKKLQDLLVEVRSLLE